MRSFGGAAVGPIILDDVRCTGFEGRLFDCPNNGPLIHTCTHSEDVGVVCLQGITIVTYRDTFLISDVILI